MLGPHKRPLRSTGLIFLSVLLINLPILQEQCHVIMSHSLAVHRRSVSNSLNIVYYIKLSTGA